MFEKRLGKKLGSGFEKEVFEDLENPKFAIGVFHEHSHEESPHRAKGRFYLTKILNLLFPENIPDFHLAATKPHAIIVDKVEGRKFHINTFGRQSEDRDDLSSLREKIGSLDIVIDSHHQNFMYDEKDNMKYVDSINPWYITGKGMVRLNYNPVRLAEAMQNLKEEEKVKGLIYLSRLENLRKEEYLQLEKIDRVSGTSQENTEYDPSAGSGQGPNQQA